MGDDLRAIDNYVKRRKEGKYREIQVITMSPWLPAYFKQS